jgi:hypothetical protein
MVINMLIIHKNYKKKHMQRKKSFRVDIGRTLREVIKKQTFEPASKRSMLFKFKPPACRAYAPEGKEKILTTGKH